MADVVMKGRGWQGAVLKLFGADDYILTVTGSRWVTDGYLRLSFTGGGLLRDRPVHPTMWIRIWFENDQGKMHQRGYTLVDADAATDTFDIEFAIHEGAATRWAQTAEIGDTIGATFMGSKFAIPDPAPVGWLIAGDPAALPAINSLLDAISASSNPEAPATIWFETSHDSDDSLPVRLRPQDTLHRIPRGTDGSALVEAVRSGGFAADGHFGWVALDTGNTRAVAGVFKKDYGLDKRAVKAQAYWMENAGPS